MRLIFTAKRTREAENEQVGMDLVDQHYVQRGYLLGDQTGGQMNDGNITCDTCGGVFSAVRQMRGHACSGNPTPQQPGPREWWIEDIEANRTVPAEQAKHRYLLVVERSALTDLEQRFANYKKYATELEEAGRKMQEQLTMCEAKLAESRKEVGHIDSLRSMIESNRNQLRVDKTKLEQRLQAERERADRTDDSLAVTLKRVRQERDAARAEVVSLQDEVKRLKTILDDTKPTQ